MKHTPHGTTARSRLERGRKAEKEESRKEKRLLVFSVDPLTYTESLQCLILTELPSKEIYKKFFHTYCIFIFFRNV